MSQTLDILITEEDLTLSEQHNVGFVSGVTAITQDIKHLILETGYLVEMIGQRDAAVRADLRQKIAVECEKDNRLVAGSVVVNESDAQTIHVGAVIREGYA